MANQGTGFIPRLEALRGVAAVLVGFYHTGGLFLPNTSLAKLYFGLCNGMGCVVVFFVISGFVLARSLNRQTDVAFLDFLKSRAFRLFPAGTAVVVLLTALHHQYGLYVGFEAPFDAIDVLLNMLMLKSDVNFVMWSMTVELLATPMIFFGTLVFLSRGPIPLLAATSVLFGLSFVGQYTNLIGANLAPLYAFLIGMLVHFEGNHLASLVTARRETLMVAAGLLLFFVSGILKPTGTLMILMEAVGGAMLVLSIAQFPLLKTLKPLDFSVVRFYGRISYSYYLLNPLFMTLAVRLFGDFLAPLPAAPRAIAMGTVAMMMTTLPAYLSWRFIELPGIAFGRAVRSYQTRIM